jgi:hypothetical protein
MSLNLSQLQVELEAAGVDCGAGLGMSEDHVFTYAAGQPADFPAADQATVDQVMSDHVAMRDKSDAEYAAEYQDSATTAQRRQQINAIMTGLLPRDQVPA